MAGTWNLALCYAEMQKQPRIIQRSEAATKYVGDQAEGKDLQKDTKITKRYFCRQEFRHTITPTGRGRNHARGAKGTDRSMWILQE